MTDALANKRLDDATRVASLTAASDVETYDGGTRLADEPTSDEMAKQEKMPIRDKMWPDESYNGLDPGIRFAVRVLHAAGFETCQSCQGGEGHAYGQPTVEMVSTGDDSEGFGALAALQAYGLPVADISIRWPVRNGLPYERLWCITFYKTMEDRVDDRPSFIYGYRAQ